MKPVLFLVVGFAALLIAAPVIAQPICLEHPNPLNPRVSVAVDCPNVVDEDSTPGTNARRDLSYLERRDEFSFSGTDYFQVSLTCTVNATLCAKVQKSFQTAGEVISGVILFNTPIQINATFLPFCVSLGDCGNGQEITLGGSYPSRTIAMQDSDGIGRYYPQALVKQLNISNHPAYGPYDITSMFNADASFWFNDDGPIAPNQSDFLWVIIHEFMHGLGFYSNWNDYLDFTPTALTPDLTQFDTNLASPAIINGPVTFNGFYESAFDKHMVFVPNLTFTTTLTRQLDTFDGGIGTKYADVNSYYTAFMTSVQFNQGIQMLQICTTARDLGFMPYNGSTTEDVLILETSLKPFLEGSSISHVDLNTYSTTSDFLMVYLQEPGFTLQQAIARGGGGPIGPRLLRVLSSLGYATFDNPTPNKTVLNIPTSTSTNMGSPTSADTSTDTSSPLPDESSDPNSSDTKTIGIVAGVVGFVIIAGIVGGYVRRRKLQSSPVVVKSYAADTIYPEDTIYPGAADFPGAPNYAGTPMYTGAPLNYPGADNYEQPATVIYYPQNQNQGNQPYGYI
ncbi:hypothetical protein BC937DRAFT_89788 [Endogone sp. FLAS-F59071]|nr:hypothetical protein BC937DRAFT_89788 [Endogone sp. FLAS-F59071]|eukprot:RUS17573.1 hypothetical protein BC937DRAFT_89788 [Endogone sp. FLAS-F59071]